MTPTVAIDTFLDILPKLYPLCARLVHLETLDEMRALKEASRPELARTQSEIAVVKDKLRESGQVIYKAAVDHNARADAIEVLGQFIADPNPQHCENVRRAVRHLGAHLLDAELAPALGAAPKSDPPTGVSALLPDTNDPAFFPLIIRNCDEAIDQYSSLRAAIFRELVAMKTLLDRPWQIRYKRDPAKGDDSVPAKVMHHTTIGPIIIGGQALDGIASITIPETFAPFHDFGLIDPSGQRPAPGSEAATVELRLHFLLSNLLNVVKILAGSLPTIQRLAKARHVHTDIQSLGRLNLHLPVFQYWPRSPKEMSKDDFDRVLSDEKPLLVDARLALQQMLIELEAPTERTANTSVGISSLPAKRTDAPILNKPSDEAFTAYRARIATGKTQTEIAELLTNNLRRPINQGQISRWLKQAEEWIRAGNVLPELPVLTTKPVSVDPDIIEMGERQDRRTRRQRGRKTEDDEDGYAD